MLTDEKDGSKYDRRKIQSHKWNGDKTNSASILGFSTEISLLKNIST